MTRTLVASLILLFLIPFAFIGIGENDFTLDADRVVNSNPVIRGHQFGEAFRSSWWGPGGEISGTTQQTLYRPVTVSFFILVDLISPEAANYNHANVLLHALVAVLRFLFLLTLLRRFSYGFAVALGASLFAAWHGISAESVVGMVGAAEMLSQAFVVTCWWLFTLGLQAEENARRRWIFWGTSALAWLLALLSKENAAMFPAVLFLHAWLFPGTKGSQKDDAEGRPLGLIHSLLAMLPFVVVLAIWATLRVRVLGSFASVTDQSVYLDFSAFERVLSSLAVMGSRYLPAIFWPFGLNPNVTHQDVVPPTSFADLRVLLGALVWAGSLALTAYGFMRRRPAALFALFGLLLFFPTSNLVIPIGAVMGYRFFYASIWALGVVLALWGARSWTSRRWLSWVLISFMGLSALVGVVATNKLVKAWQNLETLTTYTSEHDEGSLWALYNGFVAGPLAPPIDPANPEAGEFFRRFDAMEKDFAHLPSGDRLDQTTSIQAYRFLSNRAQWETAGSQTNANPEDRVASILRAERTMDRARRYAQSRPEDRLDAALQSINLTLTRHTVSSQGGRVDKELHDEVLSTVNGLLVPAKSALEELGDRAPIRSQVRYHQVWLKTALLRRDESAANFYAKKVFALAPGDPDTTRVLVEWYLFKNRKAEALAKIEESFAAAGPTVGLSWVAVQLCRDLNKPVEGRRYLERMVNLPMRSPAEVQIMEQARKLLASQAGRAR